jgi:glucose/mannose-6-phosphate isomerase
MMDKLIEAFTSNITEAVEISKKINLKSPANTIQNIVICGMGGSGIGGKLVSQWVENEIDLPITLCSDYSLPKFVSNNTLVIGSSYSGNTEETMASLKIAKERGAHIICISSGGAMETYCKENGYDIILVPGGNQPRAAIAFSLVQLIAVFEKLNLIGVKPLQDMISGGKLIDKNLERNKVEGEKIAHFLKGKIGVIYSETQYEGVAVRARQQLNENSKFLGWSLAIPEMNHNELVGWGGGTQDHAVIFFKTDDANPRNAKRIELTSEILAKKTSSIYNLESQGTNLIERSLHLINVMDWASYYLVALNGVDAYDIIVIDHLKDSLAKI